MNAQQLNSALALTIGEAIKSCAHHEIDPAQIVGILEMHKSAVITHVAAAQAAQEPTIIPFRRMPNGDELK